MNKLRYRFGLGSFGQLLDVSQMRPEDRRVSDQIHCVSCGRQLVAVLGGSRERHFRHKSDAEPPCSPETYLHAVAKKFVSQSFRSAVVLGKPYKLQLPVRRVCTRWEKELGIVCKLPDGLHDFDLTAFFDTAHEEARVGPFVADVLLTSSRSNAKLLIEMAVTHQCEPQKVESGLKIVELNITDEKQLARVKRGLDCRQSWINAHNMKEQPPEVGACRKNCQTEATAFHVFKSGKSIMQSERLHIIAATKRRETTVYSYIVDEASDGLAMPYLATGGYREEAQRAYCTGVPIRCCAICRYAGSRTWEKPIFCKLRKEEVGVNEAATCQAYLPKLTKVT